MNNKQDLIEYTLDNPVEAAAEIETLRRQRREHERFVGTLHELLEAERYDDATSRVREAYDAIHGPRN